MEQRDYLMRQIEQMGRVLGKILADLIGLKQQGQVSEGMGIVEQTLKSELDIDIYELIKIPVDDFVETLKKDKNFADENLDSFADLLFHIAGIFNQKGGNQKAKDLFQRSLVIYEYLHETQNTYSFERFNKIQDFKKIL